MLSSINTDSITKFLATLKTDDPYTIYATDIDNTILKDLLGMILYPVADVSAGQLRAYILAQVAANAWETVVDNLHTYLATTHGSSVAVKASANLFFATNPAVGDSVRLGEVEYVFQTTSGVSEGVERIGSIFAVLRDGTHASTSARNLFVAVNAGGTSGATYESRVLENGLVDAYVNYTTERYRCDVSASVSGNVGNRIKLESLADSINVEQVKDGMYLKGGVDGVTTREEIDILWKVYTALYRSKK